MAKQKKSSTVTPVLHTLFAVVPLLLLPSCQGTSPAGNICPGAVSYAKPNQTQLPANIPINDSPILGPTNAPITIIGFFDVQCPFSIRELKTLFEIHQLYPNQVKLVFKHFPLRHHRYAKPAHAALEYVYRRGGPERFWHMVRLIAANPKKLTASDMRNYVGILGLDQAGLQTLMSDPAQMDTLLAADTYLAQTYRIPGTPTVFLNGKPLQKRAIADYRNQIRKILSTSHTP